MYDIFNMIESPMYGPYLGIASTTNMLIRLIKKSSEYKLLQIRQSYDELFVEQIIERVKYVVKQPYTPGYLHELDYALVTYLVFIHECQSDKRVIELMDSLEYDKQPFWWTRIFLERMREKLLTIQSS